MNFQLSANALEYLLRTGHAKPTPRPLGDHITGGNTATEHEQLLVALGEVGSFSINDALLNGNLVEFFNINATAVVADGNFKPTGVSSVQPNIDDPSIDNTVVDG